MTAVVESNLVHGIALDHVDAEYDRRRLHELDDHRLVRAVAAVVGVPRASFTDEDDSFVLHAPLELLARAALLPYVAPRARTRARLRIVSIAARYEAAGPPVVAPARVSLDSAGEAADRLGAAVRRGELDDVDAIAASLGSRVQPDELVRLVGNAVVDRLGAAGHANIYLALLARTQPRGMGDSMLRHPMRELAKEPDRAIDVPPLRTVEDAHDRWSARVLDVLERTAPVGAPDPLFIAPIVERAQERGAFRMLVNDDGVFAAPRVTPFELQRFAARTMLQGAPAHAPFGWTHCLTLAQAPLLLADRGVERPRAVYVAAAYLAAHWSVLGGGAVDPGDEPVPVEVGLDEGLGASPSVAAASAWHAPSGSAVAARLATRASLGDDAHRVKYTLACLDAIATDRAHTRLYLAAAAYLSAWWDTGGASTP